MLRINARINFMCMCKREKLKELKKKKNKHNKTISKDNLISEITPVPKTLKFAFKNS